jgi:hypothetical protein
VSAETRHCCGETEATLSNSDNPFVGTLRQHSTAGVEYMANGRKVSRVQIPPRPLKR